MGAWVALLAMACGAWADAFAPLSLWGEGILNSDCEVIPIAAPEFTKIRINENPLLKVPPASRGNRTGAPLAVPLAKRGEPKGGGQIENFGRAIGIIPIAHPEFVNESAIKTPSLRFPLQAGGTERARFSVPLAKWGGYKPAHGLVPPAKRGEP